MFIFISGALNSKFTYFFISSTDLLRNTFIRVSGINLPTIIFAILSQV